MYVTAEAFVGMPSKNQKSIAYKAITAYEEQVIETVCEALGMSRNELVSPVRKRHLAEGRCIAIGIILARIPSFGLKRLGRIFNRDHSTAIHCRDLYNDLYGSDKEFTYKANLVLKGLE